jgi:glutaredoxin 3
MKDVVIYTGMMCGFCMRAKALLKSKNVPFREIDVTMKPTLRAEMIAKTGGKTSVPQIFAGDEYVGDCDRLFSLEHAGKLDAILAA